jgi:hypothetical protein
MTAQGLVAGCVGTSGWVRRRWVGLRLEVTYGGRWGRCPRGTARLAAGGGTRAGRHDSDQPATAPGIGCAAAPATPGALAAGCGVSPDVRHRRICGPALGRSWRAPGMGDRDSTARYPPGGLAARASALARTTSGSRGSGGRASRQGRSRRALGLWIRMRFTVISSPGRHVRGLVDEEPRPCLGTVLRGTVRAGAAVGRHPKVRMPVESSPAGPGHDSARGCPGGTAVPPERRGQGIRRAGFLAAGRQHQRNAGIWMTLPVRSWLTAAAASILSKSASPWPGRSWASSTWASIRYRR